MIHDQFGCHAGNMQTMSEELREAFVDIYHPDRPLYDTYLRNIWVKYGDGVEEPPSPGDLDLECVLNSKNFFI
jgi:DNA-directed RNA polymerase